MNPKTPAKARKSKAAKEFKEARTSWKWFERLNAPRTFERTILIEILKELQYMNDK